MIGYPGPKLLRRFIASAIGASTLLLVSTSVYAQQARLEEVKVTAQRREQSLNDIGISITARSGEQLRDAGVRSSKDIVRIAPGVMLDSVASSGITSNLTIRGISQSDYSSNQESPNSIYIDEIYIASSAAAAFPLYDLDRVEILRGPQGTLFGRASSGGLAHFISRGPSDEFEGYSEVGYGRFDSLHFEGAVSGPLGNAVRGRLAGRYEDADGWWENKLPGGKDTMETKFYGLRGQLEVDLSEQLRGSFYASIDKRPKHDVGTYKAQTFFLDEAGTPAPVPPDLDVYGTGPGADFSGYRDPYGDAQVGSFNNVGTFSSERIATTARFDWSGENISLTSITNYTTFEFDYNDDCDGGPVDYCQFPFSQELDQFSQEIRATGSLRDLVWTTGLYYLDIDQDVLQSFFFPVLSGTDFAFSDANLVEQKTSSYAVFGQLEYRMTDQFSATLGARYTRDKKEFDSQTLFFELGNGYGGGSGSTIFEPPLLVYDFSEETVGGLATAEQGMWTGKVQLDYTPTDSSLFYVGLSRGVKGPGFNTNVSANLTNPETPFGDETVYAYEAGMKLALLSSRVQVNASTFYYDYEDFQGFAFNGFQGVVGNYDGEFYGAELEVNAVPTDKLTVSLGVSYLQSELSDVPTAYAGIVDQDSVLTPEWTANGQVSRSFELPSGVVTVHWNFDYLDDRYSSIENNPATFVEGSFMHSARVSYLLREYDLEIAAFVDNIGDTDRYLYTFDFIATTGSIIQSVAKPRWWGVSLRKEF
jgi:iron complex outermembrane receptor protein